MLCQSPFSSFYPSTGTHLHRFSWMAAGVRDFCPSAPWPPACRTEKSWVQKQSRAWQPGSELHCPAAAFTLSAELLLCSVLQHSLACHQLLLLPMPSTSRSKTANSRISLCLFKKLFLLQRFKTWQEAGALFTQGLSAAPEM